MGCPERDFNQIQDAMESRYTDFLLCCGDEEQKISRRKACELLGMRKFLSGIWRSAFHSTAVQLIDDINEEKGFVFFDSGKLLR